MKKSTFIGSTVSVLLLFSVISYSRTYIQQQDPKSAQPNQQTVPSANPATGTTASTEAKDTISTVPADSKAESVTAAPVAKNVEPTAKNVEPVVLGETYTATAYSLRGR